MNTVIIVDSDDLSRRRQANVAEELGCHVIGASCLEAVSPERLRERGAVLMAAAALGVDQLLSVISEPDVEAVLIVVGVSPDDVDQRLRRFARIVDFRRRPQDLAQALIDAFQTPVELVSLALVDLLRDLHHERGTARVLIDSVPAGEIIIVAGELIHATRARRRGVSALKDMLEHPGGAARVRPLVAVPQTIVGDFQSVLLSILQQLDGAIEAL